MGGGVVCTVIFVSNPTSVLRLCCGWVCDKKWTKIFISMFYSWLLDKGLVSEPLGSPARCIVSHLSSGHHLEVFLVVGTKTELVETDNGENHQHAELGKVPQSWLEMISVTKLERLPALNGSIKNNSWKKTFPFIPFWIIWKVSYNHKEKEQAEAEIVPSSSSVEFKFFKFS